MLRDWLTEGVLKVSRDYRVYRCLGAQGLASERSSKV